MGQAYEAICQACGTRVEVNDGPSMSAIPLHCDRCGRERWWEFKDGFPTDEPDQVFRCSCGGEFTSEALPRCPKCRSSDLIRDPNGIQILYD